MLTDDQKRKMVSELKDYLNTFTNADFARKMGITPQNAYAWISRGSFNAELVALRCPEISGDWLLTGKGKMLREKRTVAEEDSRTVSELTEDIKRLTFALEEERKITAKAQGQADRLIELMHSLTEMYKK